MKVKSSKARKAISIGKGLIDVANVREIERMATDHASWGPRGRYKKWFLALALCGEAGELANKFKKDWRGDKGDRRAKAEEELCDVFAYTMMLSKVMGFDIYSRTLAKLRAVEQHPEYKRLSRK